jgi:hypothetical protein
VTNAPSWGRLPYVAAIAGVSLVLIATADTGARFGAEWSEFVFWIGVLGLFLPGAIRIVLPATSRVERIGCVIIIGGGTYLLKVLYSPVQFVFGDEFSHLRTAQDILLSGHLFSPNPLLIVSPFYPGLELATTALVNLTGLSLYGAGLIVVGVARLILCLSLFLLAERITGSTRIGGLAVVLYAANPNFAFWSAQYAYESLSLPIAVFLLYLAARRARETVRQRSFEIALAITLFALVVIHHLTSYAMCAVLIAWMAVSFVLNRLGHRISWFHLRFPNADTFRPPVRVALAGIVWSVTWLVVVAPATFRYLDPVIGGAMHNVLQIVIGERSIKPFFRGDPSLVSPVWERVIAFGAVGALSLTLLVALARYFSRMHAWPRFRTSSLALTFALAAALYYPAQVLRLSGTASEISNRSGEFLYLPMGILLAAAIGYFWLGRRSNRRRVVPAVAFATLLFAAGVIIGMPRWARMPGPYLVSGDTRAIQSESLALGSWFPEMFGTGNAVVADTTNQLVLGSYGDQNMLHGLSFIYFSPELDARDRAEIQTAGTQFIVVDQRMTLMLPVGGYYYEVGEPGAGHHTAPITIGQLTKFESLPGARQVFDSGDIAIYALVG